MIENEEETLKSANQEWIHSHCSDFEALAESVDKELWREAKGVAQRIAEKSKMVLNNTPQALGGGGIYPFLYFITRYLKPKWIVETGVAAGFSSYAFLLGIEKNQKGRLYSSDFPYFRLDAPEKLIGIVVDDSLKSNWELFIEGDEFNLPKILEKVPGVDIFHYDSDKSYSGRSFGMAMIEKKMSARGLILMDDIQDNSFFYDYIKAHPSEPWSIFRFEGKYVGMIGKIS